MGQLAELFVIGLLIVGGFYVYKHPELIDQIKNELGNIGNKGGNTNNNTEETGGNTNKEEGQKEEEEPKKKSSSSKYVAVYSSRPQTVIRTPSTIY